ncbi:N,N-dimethylformamidase beta subunit family domain-containing protein [Embleya sp. NPDC005575]|uniref:N,N-dimethylformamidase beta subunit family domain-containing protein n=1 Tax=Embleya sp. NPDC005575 TaxID=3156892 RepID=UPI0033BC8B79
MSARRQTPVNSLSIGLVEDANSHTVAGYPARVSTRAGDVLVLHVATTARRFRADFHRAGHQAPPMASVVWAGERAEPRRYDEDWQWPRFDFSVPSDWPSGVYIVVLTPEPGARPPTVEHLGGPALDARTARLLVLVTPSGPRNADVLYKVPILTYHAYNLSGGGSLYGPDGDPQGTAQGGGIARVNLRRPGGGVGGPVKGMPDAHDLATPRQTFAHWDAPFIAWLESNGIACDFCTDLDLHEGRHLDDGYRLLLSAGHDEYWTDEIRRNTETFRDAGGNIANFGANTCWWRIRIAEDDATVCCEKYPPLSTGGDPDGLRYAPDKWWETEPENSLTGVSYRNGGGHWSGIRAPIGYTVQHTDHWAFAGTGMADGDVLGAEHAIVGYECDGARFDRDPTGRARPTGSDGTPTDFTILGIAELPQGASQGWEFSARDDSYPPRAATFGLYTRGGTVFTAATTDWSRALMHDRRVATVTRNVITRLSRDQRN